MSDRTLVSDIPLLPLGKISQENLSTHLYLGLRGAIFFYSEGVSVCDCRSAILHQKHFDHKGAIIFYREGGAICPQFFLVPPFAYGEKFWSPLWPRKQILVPPQMLSGYVM